MTGKLKYHDGSGWVTIPWAKGDKGDKGDTGDTGPAGAGAVDSVNTQTGVVVLDADDIDDAATTNKFATAAQLAVVDSVETNADVTDATNVAAAGALMDSEVTNLAQVKAFDSTDYATSVQGTLADTATQPGDLAAVATSGDADDVDDSTSTNVFVTAAEKAKLATVQENATASPSVRYATKAGTVSNVNVVARSTGPASAQTLEIQYVPYDSTPTLLATLTIPTTAGIVTCPVFSQALRVTTDGNGSITDADGIQAVITAGPTLPPPVVTFS